MAKNYHSYTKKPINAAQYTMMRGVTDFTNAEQMNLFEKGHSMLVIIDSPVFVRELAKGNEEVANLLNTFCNILEYEFKGLDGIEDISAEDLTYTDGISELAGVGKVNEQSNSEISMRFTEKSGSAITKFIKFYLNGVRDSRTQTKHYYGLIADGLLNAGFENEVFNFLYLVTDSTGLQLEAAYLLANAWPNSAKTGTLYSGDKGQIESAEIDVTFKCFVMQSEAINQRAVKMLAYLNEENSVKNAYGFNNTNGASSSLADSEKNRDNHPFTWDSQYHNYEGLETITSDHTKANVRSASSTSNNS